MIANDADRKPDPEVLISRSPEETRAIARRVAASCGRRAVLALHGELGSGKTCFVQGIAQALGICRPVTSPTFTIISEYAGSKRLFHIDLYRLGSEDELLTLGIDEYFESDGITAIEWAERAGRLLPPGCLHAYFEPLPDADSRRIVIQRGG